jgi:hypothetical protein
VKRWEARCCGLADSGETKRQKRVQNHDSSSRLWQIAEEVPKESC